MNSTTPRFRTPATGTTTLRQVLSWAEQAGESYAAICELRKIPARLGLSDDDLGEIPGSLVHFERVVSGQHGSVFAKTKDPEKARRTANARIRALLQRFEAAQNPAPAKQGREDWDALVDWVEAREGFDLTAAPFAHSTHRALFALRHRVPVAPTALTAEVLQPVVAAATPETRKAIGRGLRLLSRLAAMRAAHPDLAALLPASVPALPPSSDRARRLLWADLPAPLRRDAEAAMRERILSPEDLTARLEALRDGGATELEISRFVADLRKGRLPKNASTARDGYRTAVTWLYRVARDLGWTCPETGALAALLSRETLAAACRDQIARSETSVLLRDPTRSQTLASRLKHLRTLARHGLRDPEIAARIDNLMTDHGRHIVQPGDVFNPRAAAVIARLKSTPDLVVRFVNAPGYIAAEAERRLAAAVAAKDTAAELAALRLYSGAVMYAVQLSRPLRPENLIRLRHRSSGIIPGNLVWIGKGRHAELSFAPGEVKNARHIRVHVLGEEAVLLQRWMADLRPRYLKLCGIADTPYVFPGTAKPRHTRDVLPLPPGCRSPAAFLETWAAADEYAGLGLTPHQCRHAVATLILSLHPGNFALVASVLGDTEDTVRRHYGQDDGAQAAQAVREALLARHPATLKKLKGSFTA